MSISNFFHPNAWVRLAVSGNDCTGSALRPRSPCATTSSTIPVPIRRRCATRIGRCISQSRPKTRRASRTLRAGRCRGRRRQRRTDWAFRPPIRASSVTWRLSARLPVRREAYSTHLRQTGLRLELGCSERRGRDGRLRRFCRTTPPWRE